MPTCQSAAESHTAGPHSTDPQHHNPTDPQHRNRTDSHRSPRQPRPRILAAVAAVAGTALALTVVPAATAVAEETIQRTAGPNRIATAVAASRDHRAAADTALLATADGYPDALAAAALSHDLDAPLLLSERDALPDEVGAELTRLGVGTVWVLGGPHAISEDVADDLAAQDIAVRRIQGADRYDTAAQIAEAAGPSSSGDVVVALGEHPDADRAWPDAVAAGTLAATPDQVPTLLTRPDALPEPTRAALEELDATRVFLLGGESTVSPAVADALLAEGYEVERIAGRSRYETSVLLATEAMERMDDPTVPVVFAPGEDFPDALSAGSLAAVLDAPLVLVPSDDLAESVESFLRARVEQWDGGALVGGTIAVDDHVHDQLEAALLGEPAPAPPESAQTQSAPQEGPQEEQVVSRFEGEASWYGPGFAGRPTASGEPFNPSDLTAAHRTLAFGTRVRVTNTANGAQVTVRINDRGPYHGGRVIDVSSAAADHLGMKASGTVYVIGEVLGG